MDLYSTSGITSFNEVNYSWKGDFLGFTFGGVHSSSLGIVRISDSDRYTDDLKPTEGDITASVTGLDETYYFGTTYTQKNFTVKFAFDHLTDSQIRKLRQVFSNKKPQQLIFDEDPYKVYFAKVKDIPSLSYLCFDEDLRRIYKGDGSINFIAYFPFAYSRFKYLEDYNINSIPEWGGVIDNKMAWRESSGMVNKKFRPQVENEIAISGQDLDEYVVSNDGVYIQKTLQLYNPGDVPTHCNILISLKDINDTDRKSNYICISKNLSSSQLDEIHAINKISYNLNAYEEENNINPLKGLFFDSRQRLVFGIRQATNKTFDLDDKTTWYKDNFIYNKYINGGDFFQISPCLKTDSLLLYTEYCTPLKIEYNYLYY